MITEQERQETLAKIQKDPSIIWGLDKRLISDKEIALAAISQDRQALLLIDEDLRNDRDIQKRIFYNDINHKPQNYNKNELSAVESAIENLKLKAFFGESFSEQKSQYYSSIFYALKQLEQIKRAIKQAETDIIDNKSIGDALIETFGLETSVKAGLPTEEILFDYVMNHNEIPENTKKEVVTNKYFLQGNIDEFYDIYNGVKLNYIHIPGVSEQLDNKTFQQLEMLYLLTHDKKINAENLNSKVSKIENLNSILVDIETNLNILSREIWTKTLMNPNEIEGTYFIDKGGEKVKEVIFKGQPFNILCSVIDKKACHGEEGRYKSNVFENPKDFANVGTIFSASFITDNHIKTAHVTSTRMGFGFSNIPLQNYVSFCPEDASSYSRVTEIENDDYDSNVYITYFNQSALSKTAELPNRIIKESKKKDTYNELVLRRKTDDGPSNPEFVVLFVDGEINRNSQDYKDAYGLAKKINGCLTIIDREAYGWTKYFPKFYNNYGDYKYGGKAPGIKSKDYYDVKYGIDQTSELDRK